jgi:hypothetical protein
MFLLFLNFTKIFLNERWQRWLSVVGTTTLDREWSDTVYHPLKMAVVRL